MKELEDHLQLVCQMIEDEKSNFHSFLKRLKKKAEWLDQFPYGLLQKKREMTREEKSNYEPSR
jgi:hypothetical protein